MPTVTRVFVVLATIYVVYSSLRALLSGSEDRPQPPPPQERPPQQPQRPHRPYRPQEESHPPSTSPPKHQQQHKPHSPRPPKHHHHPDLNQINQDDTHYVSLRARAKDEGDKMARCFEESKRAYASGDRAGAKVLSNEGKGHKSRMEQLNAEASSWAYAKNNEDRGPGEIDLHGLYVKEAIEYADRAIEAAKLRGDTTINIIVGKGLHSSGGVAKLKPALMKMHNLVAEVDPDNSGVLIVQLGGRKPRRRRTPGTGKKRGGLIQNHRLSGGSRSDALAHRLVRIEHRLRAPVELSSGMVT